MAGKRVYSVAFQNVAVNAVQDLIAVYCGSSMAVELHGVNIGQITGSTIQNLRVSVKRLSATVTPGTGGTSATPVKLNKGDAAATATARVNDTNQASSSGTTSIIHSDVFNIINGFQFFWPPNDVPMFGLNDAAVISLDAGPTGGPFYMSGTLYFAEII